MQMIEISKLTPHPRNKEFFDDIHGEKWEDFKKSIVRRGVVEPIVVTQDLVIVSGHQRVKAVEVLGNEDGIKILSVPCTIKHYPEVHPQTGASKEDQILEDLICTNIMQRGVGNTNPVKLARCIVELERIYGIRQGSTNSQGTVVGRDTNYFNHAQKTQADLAEEIGVTQQQLQNYKQLLNLIPELQDLVEKNKVKPTVAYKIIAKLPQEEQQELFDRLGESGLYKKPAHEVEKQIEIYRKEKENMEQKIRQKEIELEQERRTNQELMESIKSMKNKTSTVETRTIIQEVVPENVENELNELRNKINQRKNEEMKLKQKIKEIEEERDRYIKQANELENGIEEVKSDDENYSPATRLFMKKRGKIQDSAYDLIDQLKIFTVSPPHDLPEIYKSDYMVLLENIKSEVINAYEAINNTKNYNSVINVEYTIE